MPEKTEESVILVGDSRRAQSLGVDSKTFDIDEFVIQSFPGALVMVGDDERPDGFELAGTLLAVETFAEEFLGVRVLWPGEYGEVVPQRSTIVASKINVRRKPALRQRIIRNINPGDRQLRQFGELGWDRDAYSKKRREESEPWFRFHRLYNSLKGGSTHAFGHYCEAYHKEHPDWFALQPDGTRDNSRAGKPEG